MAMVVNEPAYEYGVNSRKDTRQELSSDSEEEHLFPLMQLVRQQDQDIEARRSRKRNRIDFEDFVTKNKRRNWRRFLAGGLISLVVLALIITSAILLAGSLKSSRSKTPTPAGISLEEWLGGSLFTKSFNGTWLSDNELVYRDETGNLLIYNVTNDSSRIVLGKINIALASSFDHQFSADRKYLLLASNYQKLFRHTYLAQYKIVNLETLEETHLVANESNSLQLATWAPVGNALIFVSQNNIYYRPKAEIPVDYQITTTGVFGTIYNGVPDWVYEEEVFSSNKALWFSPSGTKLVFGYFDDTFTPVMNIPFYGYPGSLTFQYTSSIPIHYPKSGTTNPTVKLYYVDLNMVIAGNTSLIEIECPPQLSSVQRILSTVSFPTDNFVSATWMNRVQSEVYFQQCNVVDFNCTTALSYFEKNGWVDQFVPPLFSEDGSAFLLILPQKQGNNGDWRHLVLVTNATTSKLKITALTSGTFVVTEIISWDQHNHCVYYLATTEHDPAQQHLYKVSLTTTPYKSECLSCSARSKFDGTQCLFNTAKFSSNNSHYVLTCAGPGVPETSVHDKNSKKLVVWEDNKAVAQFVAERSRPTEMRLTVPVPGDFKAQVRLLIPPNADLSGSTKYPMLVYVYGGPDSNEVTEKFNVDWGTYLVTNKSIIYAVIDGRGSGLKGNSMLFAVHRSLGTVEILDQINVTKHLQEKFPFIDRSRTAIWGWSYGGYAAGMVLAMDFDGIFKCGMSVAPVTDWALYDSIYTERFMGLPTVADNLEGYERAQLLNKVDNIKTKGYYLIHGTLDDNVHYQQSLLLAKVLEQNDILFRQQSYTDEDHGIGQSRAHLYHSLENFLNACYHKTL